MTESEPGIDRAVVAETITAQCHALLTTRGEASGVALAGAVLDRYQGLSEDAKRSFFQDLADQFDPDPVQITAAAGRFVEDRSTEALASLTAAVEPPRQELLRRLNQPKGGTEALVQMRADLLRHVPSDPNLSRIDADLRHLFGSWFNRGFLMLQPITWSSPADVLEKIIDYEAVHEITDWTDLRRRIEPADRHCFAFFHPAMPREPLVFVAVALTRAIPDTLTGLLGDQPQPIAADDADTAVFYSISNCQTGLRGISFGHFLIKQVASDLARDLPNIDTFVTLSPAPGFTGWLTDRAHAADPSATELLEIVATEDWQHSQGVRERHSELTTALAATYLIHAKGSDGRPLDPVARFHLGNGAILARINPQANLSPTGINRSAGMMVNYRYDLDHIDKNHEAYATHRRVTASNQVHDAAGATANRGDS